MPPKGNGTSTRTQVLGSTLVALAAMAAVICGLGIVLQQRLVGSGAVTSTALAESIFLLVGGTVIIATIAAVVLCTHLSRAIVGPLGALAAASQRMAQGEENADLPLDAASTEIQSIADDLAQMAGQMLGCRAAAAQISRGKLGTALSPDTPPETIGAIRNSLAATLKEINRVTRAISQGNLETRADVHRFEGAYAEVIQGLNEALDAVIAPLDMVAEFLALVATGTKAEKVTIAYQGGLNQIKDNVNSLIDTLDGFVDEIGVLLRATHEGRLSVRADSERFEGVWRKLLRGTNEVVDALVEPLGMMATAIDRIAKGDIPEPIADEYRGDLSAIKNNLNTCIYSLNGLLDELYTRIDDATSGRLGTRSDPSTFSGAYATIVSGMNTLLEGIVAPINEANALLTRVAQGDLTVRTNGAFVGDFGALGGSIATMVGSLHHMAEQMQLGAVDITGSASEILASSTQMAATTRQQASAVSEISSTVEEIKASSEQVAQRAQDVADSAAQAARAADEGSMAADRTITAMDAIRQRVEAIADNILSLSEQTQQIGEIIDTVTDIADQSNILALNAAIEAAQAGEAGKGFRVVADEVRSLAEQSRQAAAQVRVILSDIQKATNLAVMATEQGTKGVDEGNRMVMTTAQTIRALADTVNAAAVSAQQIVAGTQQQSVGLEQIVIGMEDINQGAHQTAAGANQSQVAARDLTELGMQLEDVVKQYRLA